MNSKHVEKKKYLKTFTGCWTCRSRKVKCDQTQPICSRCKNSGLECGGYSIRLRWHDLTKFDCYGNVLSNSENTVGRDLKSTGMTEYEGQTYQRSAIKPVYDTQQVVNMADIDERLEMIACPPPEFITDNKTWVLGNFGVFKATNSITECNTKYPTKSAKILQKDQTINNPDKTVPSNAEHVKLNLGNTKVNSAINDTSSTNMSLPSLISGNSDEDSRDNNVLDFNWISDELKDDVLLSAFASQGLPVTFDEHKNSFNLDQPMEGCDCTTPSDCRHSNIMKSNYFMTDNVNDEFVESALQSLFNQDRTTNYMNPESDIEHSIKSSGKLEGIDEVIYSEGNNEKLDNINNRIHYTPRTAIEIVPSKLLDKNIIETLKSCELSFNLTETGFLVHGTTNFLLNHYITNVADLMTVVTVSKNPWKKIFFPRVISGLGDLVSLGHTSNSRNSLLNAILALSCFNLINKLPKNSYAQNCFLNLGIEFKSQASNFLNLCLDTTVLKEKYKDVLTAILAMAAIDVVWGTMFDCKRYLNICQQFIQSRMEKRPKISKKAKDLHRIFSFFKLIQDSTCLDKIKEDDIHFNKIVADYKNNSQNKNISIFEPNGFFKESLDKTDGRIKIKFVHSTDENKNLLSHTDTDQGHTPTFTSFIPESYYFSEGKPLEGDFVGTDALYGLPNSLICLFADCISIVHHVRYYNVKKIPTPSIYTEILLDFEKKIFKWQPEWSFFMPQQPDTFVNDTTEAVYHHTKSFYFSLIIYYFTMARNLGYDLLQTYVEKVLMHLQLITDLSEKKNIKVLPLIWQGFIAGCASTSPEIQQQFKVWAAKFAANGMGSYWGPRQIMFEVWNRRNHGKEGDDWYTVYKDWNMNLMLF